MKSMILAAVAASAAAFATPAAARNLALTDWLDWERAANPEISPDGADIIYTRRRVNKFEDRWDAELWIMDAGGENHRFLT